MKKIPLDSTLTYSPVYKNEFGSTVCGVDFPQECVACYLHPSIETFMVSTMISSPPYGQFCVAHSTVGSMEQLHVHGRTGHTTYVVYSQALH